MRDEGGRGGDYPTALVSYFPYLWSTGGTFCDAIVRLVLWCLHVLPGGPCAFLAW